MADPFAEFNYDRFKKQILALTSLDLDVYRQPQLQRRLQALLQKHGVSTLSAYVRLLVDDPQAQRDFKSDIMINTTAFFRDAEQFERLRTTFLPELMQRNGPQTLRFWSAGCSTGAEAYTLAMLMREDFPQATCSILATDIDADVIRLARQGVFKTHEIQDVSDALKAKYFEPRGDRYALCETLKRAVIFRTSNLLQDSFEAEFDLISCRNVMIYFTQEAQDLLYQKFHQALALNGLLFVGSAELIPDPAAFGFGSAGPFFYRKTAPCG